MSATPAVVMPARLEDQRTVHVTDALAERIGHLPEHLLKSLTCDQGRELAAHERFTSHTAIGVYFCDPLSPWQRASNENTHELLRQYLPNGTDRSVDSQLELDRIATERNGPLTTCCADRLRRPWFPPEIVDGGGDSGG